MIRKIWLFWLVALFAFSAGAAAEMQSEAVILDQLCAEGPLSMEEALLLLGDKELENPKLREIQKMCRELSMCEGLFIQDGRSSKGKVYTATIAFYLSNGIPYCSAEYTNFAGTLSDAPVDYAADEPYRFVSYPTGEYFKHEHRFTLLMDEETIRIQWGESDYTLVRSSGDVAEATDEIIPFEERELYSLITDQLDNTLKDIQHQYAYSEEEKTFYIYLTMGEELRTLLSIEGTRMKDDWDTILQGFVDITSPYATAITLEIREGIGDITDGHCVAMIVDALNSRKEYDKQDTVAVIKDGVITYDFLKELSSSEHQSHSAAGTLTIGERNALRSAKSYLDVMAFSRSGLIEQLEYEGYTSAEAAYAVDACGADWYEQAVRSAHSYLSIMSFSKSGLIDQLEYDGFTYDQAVYGVTQNGY